MVRMYLCCRCIRHDIGTFGGCFDTEGLPLAWWWMTARRCKNNSREIWLMVG